MKKLRLDHDDLKVETFSTNDPALNRGTVVGHSYMTCYETCDPWYFCRTYVETCHNWGCNTGLTSLCETEEPTADNTCDNSCTDVGGCSFCGAMC